MNRVRYARKNAGFTIEELARRSGLAWDIIQKVETEKRYLRADELEPLANALGCSPLALLPNAPLDIPEVIHG